MSEDLPDAPSKLDLERRRVPLERKISLKFKEFRGFITEYSDNVSLGGMFIRTTSPKPPGTIFDFELSLTDDFKLVQGIGEVVWIRQADEGPDRPSGMGIRFLDLSPESRKLIERIVQENVARGGKPFELEPQRFPPPPVRTPPPAATPGGQRPPTTPPVFHATAAPVAPAPRLPRQGGAGQPLPPVAPPRIVPPEPAHAATPTPAPPPPPAPEPLPAWALPVEDAPVPAPEPVPEEPFSFEMEPIDLGAPELEPAGEQLPSLGSSWESESLEALPAELESEHAAALGAAAPQGPGEEAPLGEPTPLDERHEETAPTWRSAAAPAAPAAPRRPRHLPELDEVARAFGGAAEVPPAALENDETVRLSAPPRAPAIAPAPPPPRVAAPPPVAPPAPAPEPLPRAGLAYAQPARREPPRRKRSLALPIVLVLLLLLLGAGAFLYLRMPELLPAWARPVEIPAGTATAGPARTKAARPATPGAPAALPPTAAAVPAAPQAAPSPAAAAQARPSAAPTLTAATRPLPAPVPPGPSASPAPQAATAPLVPPALGGGPAAAPAPAAPISKARFTAVEEIFAQRNAAGTMVTIVGNGAIPADAFSHFRLEGASPREVVRVRGVDGSFKRPTIPAGTAEVKQVRTGYHAEGGSGELHVVVDLTGARVKLVRLGAVDNRIELQLSPQ